MSARAAALEANLAGTIRRSLPWLAVVLAAMLYGGSRFSVGIVDQAQRCLPPYTFWLIDRGNHRIRAGAPIAFFAGARMAPFFPPELIVIKRVVGLPGDRVTVSAARTTVNGVTVGEGLDLAGTLGKDPAALARTLVVPDGTLWVMGDTRDSFDARYWGPLPRDAVLGRAHAIR